jgi:hypothetical protein
MGWLAHRPDTVLPRIAVVSCMTAWLAFTLYVTPVSELSLMWLSAAFPLTNIELGDETGIQQRRIVINSQKQRRKEKQKEAFDRSPLSSGEPKFYVT